MTSETRPRSLPRPDLSSPWQPRLPHRRSQRLLRTVEHALGQWDTSTYLTFEVPELSLDSTRQHDVHVCLDAYVELAFAAAEWLMKEHGGPSLDDAPGLLAELWSLHRAP